MSAGAISFNEATKGHQIIVRLKSANPNKNKIERIECSCGELDHRRARVPKFNAKNIQTGTRQESIEGFRAHGQRHLLDVWKRQQQGTLV